MKTTDDKCEKAGIIYRTDESGNSFCIRLSESEINEIFMEKFQQNIFDVLLREYLEGECPEEGRAADLKQMCVDFLDTITYQSDNSYYADQLLEWFENYYNDYLL